MHKLAERIVDIGDAITVHDDDETAAASLRVPDFESLPSAFGPDSVTRTTDGELQIAVLAHDVSTLPPGRASDYYGETPHTWSPYQPDYPQPVADYAAEPRQEVPRLQAHGRDRSRAAVRGQATTGSLPPPSLCLVDAWVTLSDEHHDLLSRLNQIEESWVSVLIPWNSRDEGMSTAEEDLRAAAVRTAGPQARQCSEALRNGGERNPHPRRILARSCPR